MVGTQVTILNIAGLPWVYVPPQAVRVPLDDGRFYRPCSDIGEACGLRRLLQSGAGWIL